MPSNSTLTHVTSTLPSISLSPIILHQSLRSLPFDTRRNIVIATVQNASFHIGLVPPKTVGVHFSLLVCHAEDPPPPPRLHFADNATTL